MADDDINRIKICTFNIWFHGPTLKHRLPIIEQELLSQNADIIALQEVTDVSLKYLLNSRIGELYFCSHAENEEHKFFIERYDSILLLSKERFSEVPFYAIDLIHTKMGRTAYWCEMDEYVIITAHLESPLPQKLNTKIRGEQLRQITDFIQSEKADKECIFLGDLNICVEKELENFAEIWQDCGTDEYTFDALNN